MAPRDVRAALLDAALTLLDAQGPDALQTRKVATAAGTSTMALYTHFGGMSGLIGAISDEGLRQFDTALNIPASDDPVTDLLRCGIAYRGFAIGRPHLYRLMFGSTSAHGIAPPSANMLSFTLAQIDELHPSFAHLARAVHRCMLAARITAGSADDDDAVLQIAAQFWSMMHGFVMLEMAGFYGDDGTAVISVLAALAANLLLALGDTPEALARSQAALAH